MSILSSSFSRRVFVDTSAYYALTDSQDSRHASAQEIARRLAEERRRLFTTNLILAETHALILARLGRDVAATVLFALDRSTTTIVRVSAADERRARSIITQFDDKDFSLTDATSFTVMNRLRIS
jgi:predicted nucleic acid-binding protein